MIELLNDELMWNKFLQEKLDNKYISNKEKDEFSDFISNKKYMDISNKIIDYNYTFSIPKKTEISKKYTDKKRVVYSFNNNEMMILKYISYLLHEYDRLFAFNLYSFRKDKSVKEALNSFRNNKNIKNMYGYKIDISNYFNSIDKDILLEDLKNNIDSDMYILFKQILDKNEAIFRRKTIKENMGAMAGLPISGFFANFYIRELDFYFINKHLAYYRYSDDIILFSKTKEERDQYVNYIKNFLKEKKLKLNESKVKYIEPSDQFDFLGFSFKENKIDLSDNTIKKIKASIHHKAKMLIKWGKEKDVESYKLIRVMNKKYNLKFFGIEDNEISWKYWFFPYINTTDKLKIVDKYLQDTERYILTGKHNKANYRECSYEMLKKYGYKSLVNEYYKFKKEEKRAII